MAFGGIHGRSAFAVWIHGLHHRRTHVAYPFASFVSVFSPCFFFLFRSFGGIKFSLGMEILCKVETDLVWYEQGKYEMRGKRRGDTIAEF